jgi:hypothetical protein
MGIRSNWKIGFLGARPSKASGRGNSQRRRPPLNLEFLRKVQRATHFSSVFELMAFEYDEPVMRSSQASRSPGLLRCQELPLHRL